MLLMTDEVQSELSESMQAFVRRQEVVFVATGGDDPRCTLVSGGAGFVRVLDVNRLAWPEFPGNGTASDPDRIARDPEINLVFVDSARGATELHVTGFAKVLDDDAMRRAYRHLKDDLTLDIAAERRPDRWVTVYVDEACLVRP